MDGLFIGVFIRLLNIERGIEFSNKNLIACPLWTELKLVNWVGRCEQDGAIFDARTPIFGFWSGSIFRGSGGNELA